MSEQGVMKGERDVGEKGRYVTNRIIALRPSCINITHRCGLLSLRGELCNENGEVPKGGAVDCIVIIVAISDGICVILCCVSRRIVFGA